MIILGCFWLFSPAPPLKRSTVCVCLQVDGLIMQCVQSALAMVKDGHRQEQRETKRVNIVMKALKQSRNMEHGNTEYYQQLSVIMIICVSANYTRRTSCVAILMTYILSIIIKYCFISNWWKGKPSGSIACTRKHAKIKAAFYAMVYRIAINTWLNSILGTTIKYFNKIG